MNEPIQPLTITLTAEEVLGLRYIHSHWAHSNGNAPFCDVKDIQREKDNKHGLP